MAVQWWKRELPGSLNLPTREVGDADHERYALAVSRLRWGDQRGEEWLTVLAAWEQLRRIVPDDDGAVEVSIVELCEAWQITPVTWERWRRMLLQAGLLNDAPTGYYVNPLGSSD